MPLTSKTQVCKNLPSGFAERFAKIAKRTPVDDQASRTEKPSKSETEPTEATQIPTPKGCSPAKSLGRLPQSWTIPMSPSRGPSPRMASSLENVDLWEESDNDDSYDEVNGVTINPRNTVDFADLRVKPSLEDTETLNSTFSGYDKPTLAKLKMAAVSQKRAKPRSGDKQDKCAKTEASEIVRSPKNMRRVKFSNVVAVQEGEFSTVDLLKTSQNSAQIYRSRFLRKGDADNLQGMMRNDNQNLILC